MPTLLAACADANMRIVHTEIKRIFFALYIDIVDIMHVQSYFSPLRERFMDTELARTFLAVIAAGNFVKAAERLYVTQSTVSARIKTLEEQLGCKLFIRNKAQTTPTPAGQQFQKYAAALVRTVEQARQDVGIPRGFRTSLTVGGRFGLWDQLLLKWLQKMRERAPDVSIRAEIGFEKDLMQALVEGRLDIGMMYTPESRPGLTVQPLLEEILILVSTDERYGTELDNRYVYVDWGPEFYTRHSAVFADFIGPAITASIGWLGLHHILTAGGAAYLPRRMVQHLLDDRTLFQVEEAPTFTLPAYVVHSAQADNESLSWALEELQLLARVD